MHLFAKDFTIINIEVLFKNYKKQMRKNWGQNKDRFNILKEVQNTIILLQSFYELHIFCRNSL